MSTKYDKIKIIGQGTFGQVWLAKEHRGNKHVVIKQIQVSFSDDTEQYLNEVKILSSLHHVNVIRYKDAYLTSEEPHVTSLHIVMEYAHKGDLCKKIKDQHGKPFDEEVLMNYFVQISYGIMYIHSQNVIHRDLKTQNIFINEQNMLKIGDFGISRLLSGSQNMAQTAIGTPYYLAPEICLQKSYNFSCDIWGLGCILYELATFRRPFTANNMQSLMRNIVSGKYRPLTRNYSSLVKELIEILLKLNPSERPSMRQILRIPGLQKHVKGYVRFYEEFAASKSSSNLRKFNARPVESENNKQALAKNRNMSETNIEKKTSERVNKDRSKSFEASNTYVIINHQIKSSKNIDKSKESKNSSNFQKKISKSTSDADDKISFGEWFRCRRCSFQSEWNNRLYGNINVQFENLGHQLGEKLGEKSFNKAVDFLIGIWDQKHSCPLNELSEILGVENMEVFPQLIKFVSMKKSFCS